MCRICEGATREQVNEETRCHIIHHGWFLQGILGDDGKEDEGWIYTVGLLENFGHPELVITNVVYPDGGDLLNHLGELIRGGLDLRAVSPEAVDLSIVRPVHPWHFEHDLVNTYIDLYDRWPTEGDYLQVVRQHCEFHHARVTDLSVADPVS